MNLFQSLREKAKVYNYHFDGFTGHITLILIGFFFVFHGAM